ncbi:DUF2391 family protein [Candidatus Woesearchaeota archaeon]|nr:DUF2391 family protein [Candidatus Woesearchaeota archaeon]
MRKTKIKKEVVMAGNQFKEVVTVRDEKGHILHKFITPLMIRFRPKDMLQVMIGASILAIPVGLTEEVWNLAASLPLRNITGFLAISLMFIASFVYYNYYKNKMGDHWKEFLKRVIFTYVFSFFVVAILLTLIQRAPWSTDWILAVKRVIIVTFPASMSAAVADMIK